MITSFKIFEHQTEVEVGEYYHYAYFTPNFRVFKAKIVTTDGEVYGIFKNGDGMWLWVKNIDRNATKDEIDEFKMHEKTRKFNV